MKGGTVTTAALSNVDINVTGPLRRDKRAMGDGPA
jgi:hypothetical protein